MNQDQTPDRKNIISQRWDGKNLSLFFPGPADQYLSQTSYCHNPYHTPMSVLQERPDDPGDDEQLTPAEWRRVRKARKEYQEGKYLSEEEVMVKYGIK